MCPGEDIPEEDLEVADGSLAGLVLVVGPPAGAVIGYNLSRPKTAQTSSNSFGQSSGGSGSKLSLLVPEVELRRDRFSNSLREPIKGSPTLAYKVTLARLSF